MSAGIWYSVSSSPGGRHVYLEHFNGREITNAMIVPVEHAAEIGALFSQIAAELAEPPASDPRPDPRTHPEHWTE